MWIPLKWSQCCRFWPNALTKREVKTYTFLKWYTHQHFMPRWSYCLFINHNMKAVNYLNSGQSQPKGESLNRKEKATAKSENHCINCTYRMHFSMWVWQNRRCRSTVPYTAKYRISLVSWAKLNRSSFSFRLPICDALPTFCKLTLGIGLAILNAGGSRIGSSRRLSQMPKLSQVAGHTTTWTGPDHLGSEVELWHARGVTHLSSWQTAALSSTLLLTWFPPLLPK